MHPLQFTEHEKIAAFDRFSECFLKQNFGSVGKSDLELLFFSVVWEHLQAHHISTDDYFISNILGITQQRVRNLKIKNQLRNQYAYDWKADLVRLARNARYSDDDRYITISLDNPILMIEIQHFIETKGGMVDFSINPKLLKMQTRDFAVLLLEIGMVQNENGAWKLLREVYQTETNGIEEITKENWQKTVGKGALNFAKGVIAELLTKSVSL